MTRPSRKERYATSSRGQPLGIAITSLLSGQRSLRQEKAHHHPRGVKAHGLGIAAARIAAEPGVPAALDQPLFRDGSAVGVFHRRAADAAALDWPVKVASRERSLSAL